MAVQSYAIYIRYPKTEPENKCKPGVNTTNNVKPRADNPVLNPSATSSNGGGASEGFSASTITGIVKTVKNPMSTLLGTASKAVAPIAVAIATAKVIDSVVDATLPFYVGYTGDVRAQINYANFKSVISAIMNPVGTAISGATREMELYQENLKTEQRRALTGNSLINNYGGKTSN